MECSDFMNQLRSFKPQSLGCAVARRKSSTTLIFPLPPQACSGDIKDSDIFLLLPLHSFLIYVYIPCSQKGGNFYPILLHKFITHRTGKIYLLFPDGLYTHFLPIIELPSLWLFHFMLEIFDTCPPNSIMSIWNKLTICFHCRWVLWRISTSVDSYTWLLDRMLTSKNFGLQWQSLFCHCVGRAVGIR